MVSVRRGTRSRHLPSVLIAALAIGLGGGGIVHVLRHPEPPVVWASEFLFVGVPIVGLVYGSYWMASRHLPSRFRWSVVRWVLGSASVAGVVTLGYLLGQSVEPIADAELGFTIVLVSLYGAFVSLFTAVSNGRRYLDRTRSERDSSERGHAGGRRILSPETDILVEQQYEWTDTPPAHAVVAAIAAVENTEITEMDVTLYDHIHTDALNRIVTTETSVVLLFPLETYWVLIDGDTLSILQDPVATHRGVQGKDIL
ncbi:hypothetical protein D8Y22_20585 [Salinadaptatus halalkaliphilus]|uniref:Archaeal histidine kinase 4TM domain-containing protein n=1 Tax=Salinadaptatus halalkaliphilus TaxID=2419781 RepID=A0A4S3TG16_9EURY|nr:HalOD1 output domain-containing protein [Salinadaptatus halalkaliphilus]THE62859.1 hypothetical protein D8Y22_20585 [Salinadaptatus halalkaliphilus]